MRTLFAPFSAWAAATGRNLDAVSRVALILTIAAAAAAAAAAPAAATAARPGVYVIVGQSNAVRGSQAYAAALDHPPIVLCAEGGIPISELQPGAPIYNACLERVGGRRVAGVIFHQGETDASYEATAVAWRARFARFVRSFRRDLGQPSVPVAFAQLGPLPANDGVYPWWESFRRAQLGIRLPRVAIVKTSDQEATDGAHFTEQGYRVIGQRFARALRRLAR